jgi:hypothetical protein
VAQEDISSLLGVRKRVFLRAGWLILLVGAAFAVLLPPGRGTCGLPPVGTNEFCQGNDYSVKLAVFVGSLGTGFALLALAWWKWTAVSLAAAALVLTGFGVSALVPDDVSCPAGRRVLYGVTPDARPVCSEVRTVRPAPRVPPTVDERVPLRVGLVLGGFVLAGSVIVARTARDWRRAPT